MKNAEPRPGHAMTVWMSACRGRSAARSTCAAVRCRAGAVTNAGVWYGPGSAERHEECRTASGTRWSLRLGKQLMFLLIQPDVLEAGVVVDAVLMHGKTLHIRLPAGAAAVVFDDGPRRVLDQQALDVPYDFLALVAVGFPRLLEDQFVDLRVAIFGVIARRLAGVI